MINIQKSYIITKKKSASVVRRILFILIVLAQVPEVLGNVLKNSWWILEN